MRGQLRCRHTVRMQAAPRPPRPVRDLKRPLAPSLQLKWLPAPLSRRPWLLRLVIRSLFVCLITFLGVLIPFFTQLA